MQTNRGMTMVVLLGLLWAPAASGQLGPETLGPQVSGVWKPVVGAGAVYQYERRGRGRGEMEIAVVASETFEGKPGHWLEMAVTDPTAKGHTYLKHLVVLEGKQTQVKRIIMQAPGQPPMEFPVAMMEHAGQREEPADIREQAERIGTESVTTPAGTFTCEHWQSKDGSDIWYTEEVPPYGLVKMTGKRGNMTLVRVITGAKSRITGTPQKFDLDQMMRQPRP